MNEDTRTPEERAAGKAAVREWLANLGPPWREVYEQVKARDPKGQPRKREPIGCASDRFVLCEPRRRVDGSQTGRGHVGDVPGRCGGEAARDPRGGDPR